MISPKTHLPMKVERGVRGKDTGMKRFAGVKTLKILMNRDSIFCKTP